MSGSNRGGLGAALEPSPAAGVTLFSPSVLAAAPGQALLVAHITDGETEAQKGSVCGTQPPASGQCLGCGVSARTGAGDKSRGLEGFSKEGGALTLRGGQEDSRRRPQRRGVGEQPCPPSSYMRGSIPDGARALPRVTQRRKSRGHCGQTSIQTVTTCPVRVLADLGPATHLRSQGARRETPLPSQHRACVLQTGLSEVEARGCHVLAGGPQGCTLLCTSVFPSVKLGAVTSHQGRGSCVRLR